MDLAAFAFRCFPKRIDIPAALHDQPLEAFQTSLRLADMLRKSGVRVLGDLHGRKVGDFAWERKCGFKTLHKLDLLASAFANGGPCSHGAVRRAGLGASSDGDAPQRRGHNTPQNGTAFAVPESVCELRLHELPITTRLANVARSIGARSLGDLIPKARHRTSPSDWRTFGAELLQYKDCGWLTLAEIQQLIERAISGEFDAAQIDESTAAAELLTLLEQGMAKLSPRENQFLLPDSKA